MPRIIAAIPTNLHLTPMGLPSLVARKVGGRSVLAHTVARVARVKAVDAIVLIHPAGQDPLAALNDTALAKRVQTFPVAPADMDEFTPMRAAARRWAPHAWRGGLGGATCYDELLPARPLLLALRQTIANGALLVGADWMLVDPELCQQVLELHLSHPEAMQLTFCQAPPGLAGVAVGDKVLGQLAENASGTIGQILGYVPSRAQPDPIGRDVCVQIDPVTRSSTRRFIYDSPRTAAMIDALAGHLRGEITVAPASTLAAAVRTLEDAREGAQPGGFCGWAPLPPWVTLELTPQRTPTGPLLPQHYVKLDRPPIDTDLAIRLVQQLGQPADAVLMLGGLGDALLHPDWARIVAAAKAAGVAGIGVCTDLLGEPADFARLVELPIDLVQVSVVADRAAIYEQAMGLDGFGKVIRNLQALFEMRGMHFATSRVRGDLSVPPSVPWLVPTMVKTAQTLPDMENFYDKWTHLLGHAIIQPATTGCGLMPDMSPVNMAGPRRQSCRQLRTRMTILSDGRVARCDQDWLGTGSAGDARTTPLADIWAAMQPVRQAHDAGRWAELDLCGNCHEWHRP